MNIDINTNLRELEEKNRLLKDRTLLIGENLIEIKEEIDEEIIELKSKTKKLEQEVVRLKAIIEMLMDEMQNFARRSHLEIIEKQLEMFSPLELARIKDVKNMIKDTKKKQVKKTTKKNK